MQHEAEKEEEGGRMDERMDGQTDRRTDGWMDRLIFWLYGLLSKKIPKDLTVGESC